jgi:predicted AlkP superfamily phosphohydrolase/phosphomutase
MIGGARFRHSLPASYGAGDRSRRRTLLEGVVTLALLLGALSATPETTADLRLAYVGPGAGFAFLGSFFTLLMAFVLGALSILIWPFRVLWRSLTRRQGFKQARVKKVIFLGLDGLEPDLTERFMSEGKMPNLARLRDEGIYRRLRTTFPPLSPVAWSTFSTGVNPAKHNLYDFLNRSMRTYVPELSSSRVTPPARMLKIGKWQIPLSRANVENRRKSRTFWSILGDHHVGSTILRVPITFPPEKFHGKLLSAMCTPDLLGTQGTFLEFTTGLREPIFEGGSRFPLVRNGNRVKGVIEGPPSPLAVDAVPMKALFTISWNGTPQNAVLEVDGRTYPLKPGEYSEWAHLTFRGGLGIKVEGVCRFMITATEPEFKVYLTPLNIDPEHPALPISHPSYYAPYLAKLQGPYSTLGLAEDTWALNERVIDEDAFLEQAYSICDEREQMFFSTLEKTRQGVVTCVFDTSDRVQHMFFRYLDDKHPAHKANGNGIEKHRGAIEDLYRRMDSIVGKTLPFVDDDTVLFVLSDHGFKTFQRGVNLNAWLLENGYLYLKEGADGSEPYLKGIDWSRTRAYTFGLAGLYLNVKNREGQGIVERSEAAALTKELADKLSGLRDAERDEIAIRTAYPKESVYHGPYLDMAPDIVVGYNVGYRIAWDAAIGKASGHVFEDNVKAWSGDHCIDPPLIPGVVFCNRQFEASDPGIEDLAPTTLSLFGFKSPAWMDGKDIVVAVPAGNVA